MLTAERHKYIDGNIVVAKRNNRISGKNLTFAPHKDVYVAIRDAFKAMRRQLQDYVHCLRHDVKTHHPAPHAKVSKLFPKEGYGFIETPDGREIYFHKNSVLNSSFEHLDIGNEVIFSEEAGDKGPHATSVRLAGKHYPTGVPEE